MVSETKVNNRLQLAKLSLNTIVSVFLGGATFVICFYALNIGFGGSFMQHVILCVIGYNLLMPLAVLPFSENSGWSQVLYRDKKALHWVLQCIGSALGIAGNIIRIMQWPGQAFSTTHSAMGWLSLIFTFLAVIGGVVEHFMKSNKKVLKLCHALIGVLTIFFGFVALWTGLDMPAYRNLMSDMNANVMIGITVVGCFFVFLSTGTNMYVKLR